MCVCGSVVLPALCHLFRVMEPSDDDPSYGKFKTNFTSLKITIALDPWFEDLKCLPKAERRCGLQKATWWWERGLHKHHLQRQQRTSLLLLPDRYRWRGGVHRTMCGPRQSRAQNEHGGFSSQARTCQHLQTRCWWEVVQSSSVCHWKHWSVSVTECKVLSSENNSTLWTQQNLSLFFFFIFVLTVTLLEI